MSGLLRTWLACQRLARRELLSRPLSALFTIALVVLPVAGVTTYLFVTSTAEFTAEERFQRALGGADGRLTVTPSAGELSAVVTSTREAVAARVPAADMALLLEGEGTLQRGERQVALTMRSYDTTSVLTGPLLVLRDGTLPDVGNEIAVSESVAARLGVGIGDTVNDLETGITFTVTAVQVDRIDTGASFATVDSAEPAGALVRATSISWLVRAPDPVLAALANVGPILDRAGVLARADAPDVATALAVFTAALLEVAVIIAAAFATVARQQQRQYALTAAVGGSRWMRSQMAIGIGTTVAAIGTLLGLGVGVAGASIGVPLLQERAQQDWGPLTVPWAPIAAVIVVVFLCCTGAAAVATRAVTRDPLRAPASARPPQRRVALAAGGVLVAAAVAAVGTANSSIPLVGLALIAGVAAGGLLIAAGLQATQGRVTALPVPVRIALRDAGATTVRPSFLAMAITGVVALSTCTSFLLTSLLSSDTGYIADAPYGSSVFMSEQVVSPRAANEAADRLDADRVATFREVVHVDSASGLPSYLQVDNALYRCVSAMPSDGADDCPRRTGLNVGAPVVATTPRSDLAALVPDLQLADALAAFDAGMAITVQPALVGEDGRLTIIAGGTPPMEDGGAVAAGAAGSPVTLDVPAFAVDDIEHARAPMVLLSEVRVAELRLEPGPTTSLLFHRSVPPTVQAEDEVRDVLLRDTLQDGELLVERGDPRPARIAAVNIITVGAILVLSLTVVGVGVVLSTGELRDEFAVLSVVGGTPTLRRRIAASQATLVAATGAIPGLLVGGLAAAAVVNIEGGLWIWTPLLPCLLSVAVLLIMAWGLGWMSTPIGRGSPRMME